MAPLVFGPLSDHWGRKKVLLIGMGIAIIATFGCLLALNIYGLIAFRFLQGIGTGAVLIATRASVSDLFVGKALVKQMSFMTMLMPIILAIAPTVGGVLQEAFQWQSIFIFLLCYMIGLLIFVCLRSETLQKVSEEDISQVFLKYRSHLQNRLFLRYGVNFILPSLGIFAYMTVSPFLFQEVIGLSPAEYGSLALYVGLTILVAGYINVKLVQRYEVMTIVKGGSILVILAGALLMIFHVLNILTTWSLLIPFLIFFTCMPFCVTNTASKCMTLVKHNFGAASALLSTMQFLVGALATLLFSLISDETAFSLAVCYMIVGAVSLINLKYICKLESIQEV